MMTFTVALDVNPPATSFSQFTHLLDDLWADMSLDHASLRIDRGFWERHPYERSIASKLRSGMRFLRLLEGPDNDVTPTCLELADPQQRETILRSVLLTAYQPVVRMAQWSDCTRRDFEHHFKQTFKLTNESTVSKSVTFFVSAAAMCGLELAPSLQPAAHNLSHLPARPVPLLPSGVAHIDDDSQRGAVHTPQEVVQVSPSQMLAQSAQTESAVSPSVVLKAISGLAQDLSAHTEWSEERRALWSRMITDSTEVMEHIIADKTMGVRSASNGHVRP